MGLILQLVSGLAWMDGRRMEGHVGVNDDSRIRSNLFIKRPKRFADCVSCRWCRRPS